MNQLNFKVFVNMRKNLFLVAMAAVAFAACSDDFADAPPVVTPVDESAFEKPILFNSASSALTRADYYGKDAADMLGGKFVVTGYKGSSTASVGSVVFDNFLVEWGDNTAHTTESNTSNWEYVGKGPIKHAKDNGITQQAIKYWDYTKTQYDFIAWSTGTKNAVYDNATLGANDVRVSEITPATATGTSGVAFTMEGTVNNLSQCYIADLVTVKKLASDRGTYGDNKGAYGEPVVLTFRSLGTKVRIGIYETIPGYSVKNVEFYSAAKSNDASSAAAKLFTTETNNIYTEGTYTIYYPTVDQHDKADNNQAHIKFAPKTGTTQTTIVDWGGLNYTIREDAESSTDKVYLGRSSNNVSFAGTAANNYYKYYLPNEVGTNLNLRVNYTLESIDGTKETIVVKGATAQVPSIYATWKPGFAYTYIFKISDKTNGFTGLYDPTNPDEITIGSGPAGLYPITFDAVVVDSEEDGNTQETITTVSAPSITTYQNGSNVVNNDEYTVLTTSAQITGEIYVTVNDGPTATTPDLAQATLQDLTDKAALYSIPNGYTEADVINALQKRDDDAADGTIKGRSGLVLTDRSTKSDKLTLTNEITYGVDGNKIVIPEDGSKKKAAKFLPIAKTTYAFVYTKKAPDDANNEVKYQAISFDDATVTTKYRYALIDPTGDVKKGETYYTYTATTPVSYTLKTVFLGQRVDNLYTRSGEGTTASPYVYTPASGLAVTGTTYFYTLDGGVSFKEAAAVTYADFAGAALFTDPNGRNAKTETEPVDGVAYYKAGTGGYDYCVIYPEQANGLKQIDTDKAHCTTFSETTAIPGMTYFDKYVINDGDYYAKIIKVQ